MGVWIETPIHVICSHFRISHTLYGCVDWNFSWYISFCCCFVTPCMGVWIETFWAMPKRSGVWSHPVWVCGLKQRFRERDSEIQVTPCMGVWIETVALIQLFTAVEVTPCMGVWIETWRQQLWLRYSLSHPSWVCGLKHNFNNLIVCQFRSWWFFIHYQQRNWQNRAIFLYLTPKLSGISEKIFKFAFKYNIL